MDMAVDSIKVRANNGQFVKGHNLAEGRPKGSKNKLTEAKDNIIKYASKMLKSKDFMERIPPSDFLRFIASITPKDLKIHLPNLRYMSNVPLHIQQQLDNAIDTTAKPASDSTTTASPLHAPSSPSSSHSPKPSPTTAPTDKGTTNEKRK